MVHRTRARRAIVGSLGAAVLATACASAGSKTTSSSSVDTPVRPASGGGVVRIQTTDGVEIVDGGHVVLGVPNAVASPRGDRVFSVDGTTLRTYDGNTGAVLSEQTLPGPGLRAVAASVDGERVALADTPARIGDGVMVPGREQTTVVIAGARPGPSEAARPLRLDGNLAPEAFSTDDSHLFVIEYLPPSNPDRYRVRQLDLATGVVGPVLTFDKVNDAEEMRGLSRTQVLSPETPDGQFLYTLYTKVQGDDDQYGFVHVLQLGWGLVHCIELPPSLGLDQEGGSLALSPDGRRLYVARATGAIAELDATRSLGARAPFPILRTITVPAPPGATTSALAVDGPNLWVGLGSELVSVDRQALQSRTRLTVDGPVHALAAGSAGQLVAATSRGVVLVDQVTGSERPVVDVGAPVRHLTVTPG
jgi:hypothetical protein